MTQLYVVKYMTGCDTDWRYVGASFKGRKFADLYTKDGAEREFGGDGDDNWLVPVNWAVRVDGEEDSWIESLKDAQGGYCTTREDRLLFDSKKEAFSAANAYVAYWENNSMTSSYTAADVFRVYGKPVALADTKAESFKARVLKLLESEADKCESYLKEAVNNEQYVDALDMQSCLNTYEYLSEEVESMDEA